MATCTHGKITRKHDFKGGFTMKCKIYGKKNNKGFCYPVDEVVENNNGGYSFRDKKDNSYHNCNKDEIIEDPVFTGIKFQGLKQFVLN